MRRPRKNRAGETVSASSWQTRSTVQRQQQPCERVLFRTAIRNPWPLKDRCGVISATIFEVGQGHSKEASSNAHAAQLGERRGSGHPNIVRAAPPTRDALLSASSRRGAENRVPKKHRSWLPRVEQLAPGSTWRVLAPGFVCLRIEWRQLCSQSGASHSGIYGAWITTLRDA